MAYDFSSFFGITETDQLIQREPVTDTDVQDNPSDFVEGSQGNIKKLTVVLDTNVDKYDDKVEGTKHVYYYKYQNPDFPSFATDIEQIAEDFVQTI